MARRQDKEEMTVRLKLKKRGFLSSFDYMKKKLLFS
jgi:hypothetical protein